MWTLLAGAATAAPTLAISGTCPGQVSLTIGQGTPNGTLAVLSADDQGNAPMPGGPCAGNTGLSNAGLAVRRVLSANGQGDASLAFTAPAGVCGAWVQIVDAASCQLSPVFQLPVAGCEGPGVALMAAINQARVDNGLLAAPMGASMCFVGKTHTDDQDLYLAGMPPQCNLHSWSDQGPWTPCCYTPDHAEAQCMWDKPRELTDYVSDGFEISAVGYASPAAAVQGWLNSPPHADVILNQGIWAGFPWEAAGGGQTGSYYNVWFGTAPDPGWP